MNFSGKNILITGASSGIGKALVYEFAKYDCRLFVLSRRKDLMEMIAGELSKEKIFPVECDVTDKKSVTASFNEIKNILNDKVIDIAILNAGVGRKETVEEYNSKDAEDIFNTNVLGIIYWVEQLLPDMLKNRKGIITGVSSLADNRGFSGSGFYCASKAAVTNYLEGLRIELHPYKIKVITVKPGFVKTPMTAKNNFHMPMLMEPEKAAKIIFEGIKKEKRIIQFPKPVVLGSKFIGLLPGWLYELLSKRFFKSE